ncbi:HNH endonuclease [Chryseobacterium sp. Ch-15]|uniref:HNH endonuclease n=1 Tax=Chryseobacterium muglaense TaxID=2893752 RepID=A0A9Q3YVI0_9FLAO|nr:HNH endonuclease signature motif containing protein [Chryseobacterium muglaense]MBD3905398.1 HNH endonuclease [Chryseobacterium muglaense]MCC9036877.1 HNH endonuclease [Chryseobacterium muglaense]MCM2555261.1 HNH endonuclease [Chryseobacterium muglaense]
MEDLLENYNVIQECHYKNEHYCVRDNGSVLRYTPLDKRTRPTDNKWTFGKLNKETGYLEIASVRVHRIVTTAFHGEPPTKEHIVDHIDTNKQNNHPENLRWVTKLENILLNPITAKRIEIICGNVEAFLENPSKFRDKFPEPNYKWMCTVSIEEAKVSKERLLAWANSDKTVQRGSLGEWIYKRSSSFSSKIANENDDRLKKSLNSIKAPISQSFKFEDEFPGKPLENLNNSGVVYTPNLDIENIFSENHHSSLINEYAKDETLYKKSLTSNAFQNIQNWETLCEFPCCPNENSENPIVFYSTNLNIRFIFSKNEYTSFIVENFASSQDEETLWVLCRSNEENPVKPYALAEVNFEDGVFFHDNLGSFFEKIGAEKKFTLLQGLEWKGGDSFDDYC